ncbi:hypothetical protein GFS24_03020 [Chitinophaga sp. SYP-B3965]|uniref:NB-ARC domain-containing protein n=1 Tax=Chitinophaga sp. SYP-B3965 TaxID=2663120 RepID=UPI001299ACB4|nr:ATP-binding protein [Chitinophaga sp. SYP-B3965]MRG44065.1 hypothetical protein [Chitinophaga sp. SYP-B3965]
MKAREKLLNDTEAAILLGITKELLYAYVRNTPKTNLGHTRRLVSTVMAGKNYFSEKELLEFDAYLKEPWSDSNKTRPAIPKYIEEYLKTEIGGKCPITGKGYPLDNAHIVGYAESLSHHHHNLVRVAKEEHTKADNAVISRELLQETKDRLIERLRHQLRTDLGETTSKAPHPHPVFIGREEKLEELNGAMALNRFIVLEGLGGIGKTELLLNALKNSPPDHPVLWIDVETVGSVTDLNIILINQLTQLTGEQVGNSLIESLHGKPIILVFDSLEKLLIHQREETEAFIQKLLVQTTELKIIATCQVDLSLIDYPKKVIGIEGLSREKSLQLLETLMADRPLPMGEEQAWFLEFCNGHPLSLKLVVSLLTFYQSSTEVVAQLTKTSSLKRPMLKKHDKSNALDVCLSTVYDILTDEQKKALQYLQFFSGGLNLKLAELHIEVADLSANVAALMQFFFVEIKEDRVFVVNPVRPFLKSKMQEKSLFVQLQKAAITDILRIGWVVNNHSARNKDNLSFGFRWNDEELTNLLEVFRITQEELNISKEGQGPEKRKEYLGFIVSISELLGKYFFSRGFFKYGILLNKAGITANIELGNLEEAADNYLAMAAFQSRQFDSEAHEETVKELNELAQTTGNFVIQIRATQAQSALELDKENYEAALDLYKKTLHLLEEGVNNNMLSNKFTSIADYYKDTMKGEIAVVYWRMDETQKAITQFEEILPAIEGYFSEDNRLAYLNSYANCLCEAGREQEGFPYLFRTIEGFKRIGQMEYIGNSIWKLGAHVDKYPELATHPSLDKEAFELALEGLMYPILEYFERLSATYSKQWAVNNLPGILSTKLFYIMRVICLTPHERILSEWVRNLIKGLPRMSEINAFSVTLNLCKILGGVQDWKDSPEHVPKIILSILGSCFLLNGEKGLESSSRVFQWLAFWMRHVNLDPSATAEELWDKAKFLHPVEK